MSVTSIAVIGAGTMGSGIALTAAQSGIKAFQIDLSQAALDKATNPQALEMMFQGIFLTTGSRILG